MIAVNEAKQIIIENSKCLNPEVVGIGSAAGMVLASDIYSSIDIPNYPQSSMDGYAFNYEGYLQYGSLKITGQMAAGDSKAIVLKAHEAIRIFTGAPVPAGADTVIMQEKTLVKNEQLFLKDESIKYGLNVRPTGAEIKAGTVALAKNSLLTAGATGFLAGIGVNTVSVIPSPAITIIVTGNELQNPGETLSYGQVYEANSFALKAALHAFGFDKVRVLQAKDDLHELTNILQIALASSDLILLTGGVSVGDYDFVLQAAENCAVEKLFHKIKQKPGKPLFFGKKRDQLVFGLPGNPSSVLTCFYQYVALALQQLTKRNNLQKQFQLPLAEEITKSAGLTHFLKGYFNNEKVVALSGQESYKMSSYAMANCLIEFDENSTVLYENDLVNIYLLPE